MVLLEVLSRDSLSHTEFIQRKPSLAADQRSAARIAHTLAETVQHGAGHLAGR